MKATERTISHFVKLFEKDCHPALRETNELYQMKKLKAKSMLSQRPPEPKLKEGDRMSVADPPSTPPMMDANGMIIRQDSYNHFADEHDGHDKSTIEQRTIDSYQYRLMNNYRTP
jgi:hypothetical protein